jgi:hypothetical protein
MDSQHRLPHLHAGSLKGLVLCLGILSACASPELQAESLAAVADVPAEQAWKGILEQSLESSAPGPAMGELASMVGYWEVSMNLLASAPGEAPAVQEIARGTAQVQSTLGGRFLEWSTHLDWDGTPLVSRACLGFDKQAEIYEMWWCSDLGSAQRIARGRGHVHRSGIQLERVEPQAGEVLRTRTVLRVTDEDHFELKQLNFDPTDASWVPLRMTRFTRSTTNGPAGDGGQ